MANLKGEFNYIRSVRNEGISQKTGKPFDFGTVTVSDQFESFEMDITPTLVPQIQHLQKGDKVELAITIGKRFKDTTYTVTNVKSLAQVK